MWPFRKKAISRSGIRRRSAPLPGKSVTGSLLNRHFNAALADRLNASWTNASMSPDSLVFHNLKTLRARSREQRCNNDYVRKFISMVRTNVVGAEGVILQSKIIDYKGLPDDMARRAIEDTWSRWQTQCDIKGRLHWIDFQNVIMSTIAGDGEVLIRKHKKGRFGYQLELIDPELLDVTHVGEHGENRIIHSVELDSNDGPVAYHLQQSKGTERTWFNPYNSRHYIRVPADEIIHAYITDFVDQKRGIPWVATGLQRVKMLGAYEDAALVASRIGASQMGFFRSENSDEYTGDTETDEGFEMEAEPGVFRNIGNMTLESFNPDYPKGEFADFMKQCLRGISAGFGVDYNTFANDMSDVNYSSARVGMLETREVWMAIQGWFIRTVVRPVFEQWLDLQYSLGTIRVPRRNKPALPISREPSYYLPAIFQARRWKWVDPQKELKAHELAIGLNLCTRAQIIREQGGDPDEVFREIQEENQRLESMGLALIPDNKKPPSEEDEKGNEPETEKN